MGQFRYYGMVGSINHKKLPCGKDYYYGRVLNSTENISYESKSAEKLESEFKKAVDIYFDRVKNDR